MPLKSKTQHKNGSKPEVLPFELRNYTRMPMKALGGTLPPKTRACASIPAYVSVPGREYVAVVDLTEEELEEKTQRFFVQNMHIIRMWKHLNANHEVVVKALNHFHKEALDIFSQKKTAGKADSGKTSKKRASASRANVGKGRTPPPAETSVLNPTIAATGYRSKHSILAGLRKHKVEATDRPLASNGIPMKITIDQKQPVPFRGKIVIWKPESNLPNNTK